MEDVGRLVRGDMGTSLYTTRPIADDLAGRLPATIELTLVAMAFSARPSVGRPIKIFRSCATARAGSCRGMI